MSAVTHEILELAEIAQPPAPRAAWTAVIPAAGRGSRLGYQRPKVLYPLLGRPILAWLLELLEPRCERIVLVVAPEAEELLAAELRERIGARGRVVVQPEPRGMADAIQCAEPAVESEHTLVVWGDQVLLRHETLEACVRAHQHGRVSLTLPTVWKEDPYIDFQRDAAGCLTGVHQRREGEIDRAEGENDCGLFLFRSADLFRALEEGRAQAEARGKETGEYNLLPLLAGLAARGGHLTVRLPDASQTVGVNTPAEAEAASAELAQRGGAKS